MQNDVPAPKPTVLARLSNIEAAMQGPFNSFIERTERRLTRIEAELGLPELDEPSAQRQLHAVR